MIAPMRGEGGKSLALERARHGIGIARDDRQQHLSSLVGTVSAQLPIPHGAEWEMKPIGELLLRQL